VGSLLQGAQLRFAALRGGGSLPKVQGSASAN
jgi:hypothetical protein